jgi:hypothetical protein
MVRRQWTELDVTVLWSEELRNLSGGWNRGVEAVLHDAFYRAAVGDGRSGEGSPAADGGCLQSSVSEGEWNRGGEVLRKLVTSEEEGEATLFLVAREANRQRTAVVVCLRSVAALAPGGRER